MSSPIDPANDLVRGALVADAAALGLHWIYDAQRLRDVGGDRPEFRGPDLSNYRGGAGFLAHKGKRAGDPSHYGAQLLVAVESLAATGGVVDPVDWERRFLAHFGPGGTWVGYVDYATRETLRNIDEASRFALQASRDFDLGAFEDQRNHIVSAVMANSAKWSGAKLDLALEKATRIRGKDDPELIAAVQRMGRAVVAARGGFHGSDDLQLPALSSVPATVACGADVEAAVRITHDSDEAVAWAEKAAALLRFELDPAELAGAGRNTCVLDQALPMCARIVAGAASFEEGVRANILAGGDSAGRAIVVGAYLGAKFGVPESWAARTRALEGLAAR